MSLSKINLKFEKEIELKDLTNDDLANLIEDLVNELLNRSKNIINNITIKNPYENVTTMPLTVGSPYTYTVTNKKVSTSTKNESEEVL